MDKKAVEALILALSTALALGITMSVFAGDDSQKVLSEIHQANQMEIQMGQLAEQNSTSDSIKSYGSQLVRDHTDADEEVTTIALKDNIPLLTPASPNEKAMSTLAKKTGADFDQAFLKQMVSDHQKNIMKLQTAEKTLPESDVRDLVAKILPTLQDHLARAQSIQANG